MSRLLKTIHELARDPAEIGLIDPLTMREFDALCLPAVKDFSAIEIKSLRVRCRASRAVFAAYLNTSLSTVRKWERGEKHPTAAALKPLDLVDRKGLEILA